MEDGAVPLTHERGCVEGEQSFRRTMLALTTFAKHPNVSGVLIVGLGCERIRTLDLQVAIGGGKPVHAILIQEEGGSAVEAEARGCELVRKMQRAAQDLERQPCPLSGLAVGVQCGGSDWTTAIAGNTVIGAMTDLVIAAGGSVLMSEVPGIPGCEHIVASPCGQPRGEQYLGMVDELRAEFLRAHGQPIEAVNPTPGNKAGGITTLVEKAMGNIKKMGTSPVQGVLKLGERPRIRACRSWTTAPTAPIPSTSPGLPWRGRRLRYSARAGVLRWVLRSCPWSS